MSGLPMDVLRCVVDHLHPLEDSDTLLSLMRVSSTMWECAARKLFADLSLTESQAVMLFGAGSDRETPIDLCRRPHPLSGRVRKALSFTRRLTIKGPWAQTVLDMMWEATIAGHTLFPNVQQVLFGIASSASFDLPGRSRRKREPGVYIFDTVDACVLGDVNVNNLFELPAQRYRSITCHEADVGDMLAYNLGDEDYFRCDLWQYFQSDTQQALDYAAASIELKAGRNYPARWTPRLPLHPVQLYLKDGTKLGERLVKWYNDEQCTWIKPFADISNILQIHHFPRSGAGAPPCAACGKTWRAGELRKFGIFIPSINRAFWKRTLGGWSSSDTSSDESDGEDISASPDGDGSD
ncbi:hypothetical protein A1Q1_01694 [Trichosporon asahii var. asahii CBS 2479]|uniref:F-box domain-containing protein n=1 Tax=Trichosporon asahii var. asahii (strain ATCC 90039 / CBS 2479 / JCM 2466 / KCTC 7840 / NBRC 103889/ NCYC 2677 / UAMH 7654) TaxID=1186058 RepID=J5QUR7_TRIAS|nr:hypothetical protein A1Q1_01694 [Trichosporon asahii var. asahii CBS 2479]EJT49213.1 hypothetical protein A1Q1_01694 [Trichosporon asahii var. asahii CBS 2479]